ncbi:hypothetical protein FJW07_27440 [Mesorhizobium sp. B3-1-9]|uniref:hypothetical protein n=1 Tax=Mesorhizobium sp. B3-1-9 TaxID=2589892 RepID=UPI00112941E2|nr:hypothetical protein [Mesorhizobium sp. B3-1-9]TPI32369.1 hypothetical protein FJW07_27440 [Mesorhizobium sp. B3-1-9]
MIVAQMINDFVTVQYPGAICDRCIAEALHLSSHAHAAQTTEALGTTSDFTRQRNSMRGFGCRPIERKNRRSLELTNTLRWLFSSGPGLLISRWYLAGPEPPVLHCRSVGQVRNPLPNWNWCR